MSPFYPLYGYPGPFPASISKLWLAWTNAQKKSHHVIAHLHAVYGDAVRIGPNEMTFCDSEVIAPVLGQKGLPKGPYYDTRQQEEETALDGLRNQALHTTRRKPWTRATSTAALKEYADAFTSKTQELLDALSSRQGKKLDLSTWLGHYSFDMMGQLTFSIDFGMVKSGSDVNGLWHMLEEGTGEISPVSHVPWILEYLKLVPGGKASKFLEKFSTECAQQRIENGSDREDIFHYLMDEDEVESVKPTKEVVITDGMLAVIAGSDTSAVCMSHLFYFLLRKPECLERLRKEVDEAFPNGADEMNFTKHAELHFLNACINEALRLFPAVLTGLQRRVEAGTGGKMIGSLYVPEETQVSVHTYTIQRDPRNFFPIPNEFWPDRWLSQEIYTLPSGIEVPKEKLITNRTAFIPFSYGPQNCAGKSLAMMEMRAVMCALLLKFDFTVAKGFRLESWEENIEDCYVTHHGPLFVNLQARS